MVIVSRNEARASDKLSVKSNQLDSTRWTGCHAREERNQDQVEGAMSHWTPTCLFLLLYYESGVSSPDLHNGPVKDPERRAVRCSCLGNWKGSGEVLSHWLKCGHSICLGHERNYSNWLEYSCESRICQCPKKMSSNNTSPGLYACGGGNGLFPRSPRDWSSIKFEDVSWCWLKIVGVVRIHNIHEACKSKRMNLDVGVNGWHLKTESQVRVAF